MMGSLRTIILILALCCTACISAQHLHQQQQNLNSQFVNVLLDLLKKPTQMLSYKTPAYNYNIRNNGLQTLSAASTGYGTPAALSVVQSTATGYGSSSNLPTYASPTEPLRIVTNDAPAAYGGAATGPLIAADQTVQPTDPCTPNPCHNEGVCTVLNGNSFTCACPWGWAGSRCEVCVTDCASNPCTNNKKCLAKFGGGFDCVCPPDRKGPNCEYQNDACDGGNKCLNGGSCKLEINGGYSCVCLAPYDGLNCDLTWNNPCTSDVLRSSKIIQFRNPYNKNSYLICYDLNKYHTMPCAAGTFFNARLNHCVPEGYDPPVCPDQYCLNEGECLVDDQNQFKCACKRGFGGDRCEVNIDECSYGGNAACGAGVCVDQVNGYYCRCQNGAIGLDCQNTQSNPCTEENLNNERNFHEFPSLKGDAYIHCTGVGQLIVAKCPEGLFWNQDEQTCAIDKPILRLRGGICDTFPCRNGATCTELSATTFECVCKVGYTGERCETLIDFCESNPCSNGGRCLNYAGGYTCVCPDKIVDECCCHGVTNPCPPKAKLVPGVNNYFPHLFPHRYIHCDFEGRAFVRNCAPGLRWYQDALACLSDSHVKTFLASQQQPGLSYGTTPPIQIQSTSSYSSIPVVSTTSLDKIQQTIPITPAPTSAPAPISYGQTASAASQTLDIITPQVTVQSNYGQTTATPALDSTYTPVVQSSYGQATVSAPAPAETTSSSYGGYATSQSQAQQQSQQLQSQVPAGLESSIMNIAQQMKMTPQQVMQMFQLNSPSPSPIATTTIESLNPATSAATSSAFQQIVDQSNANSVSRQLSGRIYGYGNNNYPSSNTFGRINF